MSNNYIPFYVDNFDRIQQSLQKHYINEYRGSNLKAFPKDWSRENFLEIYDTIDKFFKEQDSTIISSRFFFTPAGKSLGVHIDGKIYEPNYWALNIPIFCDSNNHWQEWFEYDGELENSANSTYSSYIIPKEPTKLKLIDQLTLTAPHLVRVGIFHRVTNNSLSNRLIASIRFKTNSLEHLLKSVRDLKSS